MPKTSQATKHAAKDRRQRIAINKNAIARVKLRNQKYHVIGAALGKFTATTNPKALRCVSRDYQTFDTREEADAWAKEQNRK